MPARLPIGMVVTGSNSNRSASSKAAAMSLMGPHGTPASFIFRAQPVALSDASAPSDRNGGDGIQLQPVSELEGGGHVVDGPARHARLVHLPRPTGGVIRCQRAFRSEWW